MSTTPPIPTGTLVAGRYQIEELLAGEGSAAVYRAADTLLGSAVALRVLRAADAGAPALEGQAAGLAHPNVARVLDFDADAALGVEFVAADLPPGGSLAALLAQRGRPPLQLAIRMVQEAAAGVAAAHTAGLVHGDLHPGMLWLSRGEGRLQVQVLGLGPDPAGTPPPRATARYASPERLRKAAELSPAADVFSLGAIAFEILAGLPPEWTSTLVAMARGQSAAAPSLLDARPEIPPHAAEAVRRALLADPAERWPDAAAMAAHLGAQGERASSDISDPAPERIASDLRPPARVEATPQPTPDPQKIAVPTIFRDEDAPAGSAGERARDPESAAADPDVPVAPLRPPSRRAHPSAAEHTDLADILYIPPRDEPEARLDVWTPRPAATPAPSPPPVQGLVALGEPPAGEAATLAEPPIPASAQVPAPPPSVAVEVHAPAAPLPSRRRSSGMARLGQPSPGRRPLMAAAAAGVLLLAGGTVAATVLGGSAKTARVERDAPAPALAAAAAAASADPQPSAEAPAEAAGAPAPEAPSAEPGREDQRLEAERRAAEEQRRLEQRRQDSLRAAQQLAGQPAATQPQAAPQQVALAAPPPAAIAPAPQPERRVETAASPEAAAPPPARPRVDPNRVYGGGEVDQAPSLSNAAAFRSAIQRSYPATLRSSGQWGNAIVSFVVGTDGRVERSSVTVEQASHPAFRGAASSALAAARFNPARVDGQPVRAQVSMPITWQGSERDDD